MTLKEREADRSIALSRLTAVIGQSLEVGERIPCLSSEPDLWTSEDLDDLREAAKACAWCPALTACKRYIDQFEEISGVYAGLTPTERKQS